MRGPARSPSHQLFRRIMPRILFVASMILTCTRSLAASEPDFARDVRPILAQYCFKCHGPDDKARKADLRLDVRQSAIDAGVIVPGKPNDSELIARIFATEHDKVMPPISTKTSLQEHQKQILRSWIATRRRCHKPHWAFVKPGRVAIPAVADSQIRNPIDNFVRAHLRETGLEAANFRSRQSHTHSTCYSRPDRSAPHPGTGPRRPVNDAAPGAYERLVDRLLASPQYGERWARRWLDLARYSDTNGYEKDRPRSIWPYRDWVINALNADMPFDQFTLKQLAGDMLSGATIDDRIATGFHRNTMLNEEGGIDPLEYRFHAMTDRVATTGTTWLGLTVGCAQCHTHKFDPIQHREYYQFFACLNNCDEPQVDVPVPAISRQRAEIEARIAKLTAELPNHFPEEFGEGETRKAKIEAAFKTWLAGERKKAYPWRQLRWTRGRFGRTLDRPFRTIPFSSAAISPRAMSTRSNSIPI